GCGSRDASWSRVRYSAAAVVAALTSTRPITTRTTRPSGIRRVAIGGPSGRGPLDAGARAAAPAGGRAGPAGAGSGSGSGSANRAVAGVISRFRWVDVIDASCPGGAAAGGAAGAAVANGSAAVGSVALAGGGTTAADVVAFGGGPLGSRNRTDTE